MTTDPRPPDKTVPQRDRPKIPTRSAIGEWDGLRLREMLSACAYSHLRIARPSSDLDRAERFWVDGLGLEVLYRTGPDAEGGSALLMLGWPQAAWHLELVGDPSAEATPSSTDEDLLVLYVGGPIDEEAVEQLVRAGGQQVAARNPYWDRWGVTIIDPDGIALRIGCGGCCVV